MTVTPIHPQVRFYCSDCDVRYFEHQRPEHLACDKTEFCPDCDRAFGLGDTSCPVCGTARPRSAV